MNINFTETKMANGNENLNPLGKGSIVGTAEKATSNANQGMKVVLPNASKQALVKEHVSLEYQEDSLEHAEDMLTDVRDLFMEVGDFENLSEEEMAAIDEQEFQMFKSEMQGIVSTEDMNQLDVLRKEATAFEKNNDFKNADITWDKFDRILDKYEEFMPDDEFDMDDEMMEDFMSEEDEDAAFDSMFENSIVQLRKQLELFQILMEKQNKSTNEKKKKASKTDQTIKELKDIEVNGKTKNAKKVLDFLDETYKLIQDEKKNVEKNREENEKELYANHMLLTSMNGSGNTSLIDLYS